jgi:sec-independent protein translocase protein TatA
MALLVFGLGGGEVVVIVLGAILLFGASRVPQLMKGLGQGIKEFKNAMKDDDAPAKPQQPADDKPAGGPQP